MKPIRSIATAILVLPCSRLSAQATGAYSAVAGCYDVSRGAWPGSLNGDSVLHAIPPRVRLGRAAPGADSGPLSPDIVYPRAGRFPPRWRAQGDSLFLVWSNGFSPTRVVLSINDMTGYAVAENDYAPPNTFPRISIALRRVSCAEQDASSGFDRQFTELGFGWNSLSHAPSPDGGLFDSGPYLRGSIGQTLSRGARLRLDVDLLLFRLKVERTHHCLSTGCFPPTYYHDMRGAAAIVENVLVSLDPWHVTYLIGGVGVYDTNALANSLHLGGSLGAGLHVPSAANGKFSIEAKLHRLMLSSEGPSWFVPVSLAVRF